MPSSIFFVLLMYATGSIIFPINKIALGSAPPVFLTGARMILAGVILIGFLLIKDRKSLKIGKKQIVPILAFSLIGIYLTNILELWSMQYLSPAKACFFYSLCPFFAVIFSYIHFREKMTQKKTFGMVLGFIGFCPVLMMQTGSENLLTIFHFLSWPDLAMIGAALCSIYGWTLLRVMVKKQTISPLSVNGYSMLFGGMIAFIHSYLVDSWNPIPIAMDKWPIVAMQIGAVTLISNIICYNWHGFILKKMTTTLLAFGGLFSPIFVSFISWFLLKEEPSWIIFLSTFVVLSGLVIIYQTELQQGYISRKRVRTAKS